MATKKIKKAEGNLKPVHFWMILLMAFLMILILSCTKDAPAADTGLTSYNLEEPEGFPKLDVPPDNQAYKERIALGRKLYYDPILSNNGSSCSSCHIQKKGFTKPIVGPGMPILPHVNMAWKNTFMWDGSKSGTLEDVMLFEVEEFFSTDISKLNDHPQYRDLFAEAYDVENITSYDVARALAQFARVMTSSDSKYDRVQRSLAQFTDDEAKGFGIFNSEKGSCYHCHTPPVFTDDHIHNIGLDSIFDRQADWGHYNVTGDSSDLGRMRTPTLRNLSLRDRFMHDGRFSTLEEVVSHYNSGVKRSQSLDPTMIKGGNTTKLNLTTTEMDQLVAFLRTLTDSTFINNEFLSSPE